MLTRVRAFVTRLRLAWRLAGCAEGEALARIVPLLSSETMAGAVFGVQKTGLDISLKAAKNEALRAEAIEWAGHWYREQGLTAHPWQVRFCVEWAVGKLKGYL